MRTTGWIAVALLVAAGGQASIIENAIDGPCESTLPSPMDDEFCHYQYDGGSYGDARDTCGPTTKRMSPGPADSHPSSITGLMVPVEDTADYYEIVLHEPGNVQITITPQDPIHADELQLTLGSCTTTLATGIRAGDASVTLTANDLLAGTYYAAARLVTRADDALATTDADDEIIDLVHTIGLNDEQETITPPATVIALIGLLADVQILEGAAPLAEGIVNLIGFQVGTPGQAQSEGIGPVTLLELQTQCNPFCAPQNLGRATEAGVVGYKQTAITIL